MTDGDALIIPGGLSAQEQAIDEQNASIERAESALRIAQGGRVKRALEGVSDFSPDDYATGLQIAKDRGLAPHAGRKLLIGGEIKRLQRAAINYDALVKSAPHLSEWLSDPANAAIAQDDIHALTEFEKEMGYGSRGFFGDLGGSVSIGSSDLRSGAYHFGVGMGALDRRAAAFGAAEHNRASRDEQERQSVRLKAFYEELEAADAWETVGVLATDPGGLVMGITKNLPNMVPALILGGAGAWGGTKAGGAIGAAGGPWTAAAGATVGGVSGLAGGTFTGVAMTEYGARVNQALAERNVDIYDGEDILRAYNDPALMAIVTAEARGKAFGTGAVEAAMALVGVGLATRGLRKVGRSTSLGARAGRGAGHLLLESGGEALGEGAGELFATGTMSPKEMVLESAFGLGQSASQIGLQHLVMRPAAKLQHKAAAALKDTETAKALREKYQKLKPPKRSRDSSLELTEALANGADLGEVRIPRDEFDAWADEHGLAPLQEAAETAKGGEKAYNDSDGTGDVVLPYANVLDRYMERKDQYDSLIDIARLRPEGLSLTEAGQALFDLNQRVQSEVQQADEGAVLGQEAAETTERAAALDAEIAALEEAGATPTSFPERLSEIGAERAAAIQAEVAKRAGVTPEEATGLPPEEQVPILKAIQEEGLFPDDKGMLLRSHEEAVRQARELLPEMEGEARQVAEAEIAEREAAAEALREEGVEAPEETPGEQLHRLTQEREALTLKEAQIAEAQAERDALREANKTVAEKAIEDYTDEIQAAARGTKAKVSKKVARAYAQILVRMYSVLADRYGMDLATLLEQQQIRFGAKGQAGTQLEQPFDGPEVAKTPLGSSATPSPLKRFVAGEYQTEDGEYRILSGKPEVSDWRLLRRNPNTRDAWDWLQSYGTLRDAKEGLAFNQEEDATPPTHIDVDGVSRPALNSDGNPIHWSVEGVRNFWRWFGDSKVVDEQGRPLALVHSTWSGFAEFDVRRVGWASLGIHVGTAEQAQKVRETAGTAKDVMAARPLSGQRSMPVYAKAANSFRMEDGGTWPYQGVVERLANSGIVDTEPLSVDAAAYIKRRPSLVHAPESVQKAAWHAHSAALEEVGADGSRDAYARAENVAGNEYVANILLDNDYDSIVYDNAYEGGGDSYIIFDPTQIKSATGNTGQFDPAQASILHQEAVTHRNKLTATQRKVVDAQIDKMEDSARLRAAVERNQGTPWERSVYEGALAQAALDSLISGKRPRYQNVFNAPSVKDLSESIRKGGAEAAWAYLENSGDTLIGHPSKPVNAVNSSFLNCEPSTSCAAFCYAARGRNYPRNVARAEIVNWAIQGDPVRAAKLAARSYKAMAEFELGKALRLLDKGNLTEAWIPFIAELNKEGIRTQVFSKHPEILSRIGDMNLKLLSIDHSNVELAESHPDLLVAVVYRGEEDAHILERYKDRIGVILPVVEGGGKNKDDAKALQRKKADSIPKVLQKYSCPVDIGAKQIGKQKGNWNCTRCDSHGGVGCFSGRASARLAASYSVPLDEAQDYDKRLEAVKDAIDKYLPEHAEALHAELAVLNAQVRAGVDIEGHSEARGAAEEESEADYDGPVSDDIDRGSGGAIVHQTAYHGSPHRFDKFDIGKLGTGEGSQAFGWGLYFAGNREVAEWYRHALSEKQLASDFLEVLERDADIEDVMELLGTGHFTAYQERVIRALDEKDWLGFDYPSQAISAAYGNLDAFDEAGELREAIRSGGGLFTVDLAPAEDEYLLWDKPISEQSKSVRSAFSEALGLGSRPESAPEKVSGEQLYAALTADVPLPEGVYGREAASKWLAERGVPGIKFRDQGSREPGRVQYDYERGGFVVSGFGQEPQFFPAGGDRDTAQADARAALSEMEEQASFNYVIFDDSLIKIIELEQRRKGTRRGSTRINSPDQLGRRVYNINFYKNADRSTFLHEASHAFMEIMGDMASSEAAPQALRDDYATILSETGYETRDAHLAAMDEIGAIYGKAAAEGRELTDEESVRASELAAPAEKFAKSFEGFWIEGDAPVPELRPLFGVFRQWLSAIYDTLKGLGAEVSPALRGVFERMVATDQELAEAQSEAGGASIFEDQAASGMSDEEWAAHQAKAQEDVNAKSLALDREKLRPFSKAHREARKAMLEKYRTEELERLNKLPEVAALERMREGADPKIDGDTVVARYGEDSPQETILRALGVVAESGGAEIDAAAETWGAPSTDDFIRGLAAAADKERVAKQNARKRLNKEHRELMTPAQQNAAANRAEATKEKSAKMQRELLALRKKGRTADKVGLRKERWDTPSLADVRKTAAAQLRFTPRNRLRPAAYRTSMAREMRIASKMVKAGREHDAFVAQRRAIMNHELYRRSLEMLRQAAVDERMIKRKAKPRAQERMNRAHYTHTDQVNAILDRFGVRKMADRQRERRVPLADYLERQEKEGKPLVVSKYVAKETTTGDLKTMTVDQIHDVRVALDGIYHVAKTADELLTQARGLTVSGLATASAEAIRTNRKERGRVTGRTKTDHERRMANVRDFLHGGEKAGWTLRQFDGDKDGGPNVMVHRMVAQASDRKEIESREIVELESQLYIEHFTEEELSDMQHTRRDFAGASLMHEDVLSIIATYGSVTGRQRLPNEFSQETIDAVLASATKADLAFVRARWELLDGLFQRAVEVRARATGQVPDGLKRAPFTLTVAGEEIKMEGGYHPAHYADVRPLGQSTRDQRDAAAAGAAPSSMMEMGFLTDRVQEFGGTIMLNRSAVTNHLQDMVHFIHMHEAVRDAQAVIYHPQMKQAIEDTDGPEAFRALDTWLRRVAIGNRGARDSVERKALLLRRNAVMARLALRVVVGFKQFFGLRISALRLGGDKGVREGTKWVALGMQEWFSSKESIRDVPKFVLENSDHMKGLLLGTWNRELNEGVGTGTGKAYTRMQTAAFFFAQHGQFATSLITWLGQYKKTLSERPSDVDPDVWMQEAIARADQTVRDTQSSGQVVDLSLWESGNPLMRLLTTYFTDGGIKFNATRMEMAKFADSKDFAGMIGLMTSMAMIYVLPSAILVGLNEIWQAAAGEEDPEGREGYGDEVAEVFFGAAGEMFDSAIFWRELSGPVQGYPYRGSAGMGVFAAGESLIVQGYQLDADPAFWRALNDFAGQATGFPSEMLEDAGYAVHQVMEGKVPTALIGYRRFK